MTAKEAGRSAMSGVWQSVRVLREQWILVMFVTGALIWARDTYEQFSRLPEQIGAQAVRLEAIVTRVSALEYQLQARLAQQDGPVVLFPGERHRIEDAAPGQWTQLRLEPVEFSRSDCQVRDLDAFMVDSVGQWFSVETALDPMPMVSESVTFAFEVRVHSRMTPGRARALIQLNLNCMGERRVVAAPKLPFRVL